MTHHSLPEWAIHTPRPPMPKVYTLRLGPLQIAWTWTSTSRLVAFVRRPSPQRPWPVTIDHITSGDFTAIGGHIRRKIPENRG
jgi:hypothetical protein